MLLGLAQRLGWRPADFWGATWFEFTVALADRMRENLPPDEPQQDLAEIVGWFRGRPEHVIEKRT